MISANSACRSLWSLLAERAHRYSVWEFRYLLISGSWIANSLESVLHVCYPLPDCLNKIVVPRDLAGDDRELMPLVPLQDTQHGGSLVLQRWGQLQLKTQLRSPLKHDKSFLIVEYSNIRSYAVTPHYIIIIILVLQSKAEAISLRYTLGDNALGLSPEDAGFESPPGHHRLIFYWFLFGPSKHFSPGKYLIINPLPFPSESFVINHWSFILPSTLYSLKAMS